MCSSCSAAWQPHPSRRPRNRWLPITSAVERSILRARPAHPSARTSGLMVLRRRANLPRRAILRAAIQMNPPRRAIRRAAPWVNPLRRASLRGGTPGPNTNPRRRDRPRRATDLPVKRLPKANPRRRAALRRARLRRRGKPHSSCSQHKPGARTANDPPAAAKAQPAVLNRVKGPASTGNHPPGRQRGRERARRPR